MNVMGDAMVCTYLLFVNDGHPVLDKWEGLIGREYCLAFALL